MGFDLCCMVGLVDEELICPICADVLEDPIQSSSCEHAFCRACIEKWILQKPTCPVDRSNLLPTDLVPVPRLMRNMLSRLRMKCIFSEDGCSQLIQLAEYRTHVTSCEHNPKVLVECQMGCGIRMPKDELRTHNCVYELRKILQQEQKQAAELKEMQASQNLCIQNHQRELELLQCYISALRSTNPDMRNVGNQLDRFSLMQWGNRLPLAAVRNWNSLISTPDTSMQEMLRKGLCASGCPMQLVKIMVERCHEDRWPEGLMTQNARRKNRPHLMQYRARLLPPLITGEACVAVLVGNNNHMPENLLPTLGLVMIFVDGVDETPPPEQLPGRDIA